MKCVVANDRRDAKCFQKGSQDVTPGKPPPEREESVINEK